MHHTFQRIHSKLLTMLLGDRPPTPERIDHVLKLSQRYTQSVDHSDIWDLPAFIDAYLNYFMPLNSLRLQAVFTECQRLNFFTDIHRLIDVGSGPGTADWAAREVSIPVREMVFVDKSPKALSTHKGLCNRMANDPIRRTWSTELPQDVGPQDAVLFSYSGVEIGGIPSSVLRAEALIVVEPSVRGVARRLQSARQTLMAAGFSIWAPCTHHEDCPLLVHSQSDWCHQRIHVELPPALQRLEEHLPMKNQSLTYSYLCARKRPATGLRKTRVIGDTIFERGKIKQAVCRNSHREFLTWLTRYGEPPVLERGSAIDLPPGIEVKSSELRWPAPSPKDSKSN